MFISLYNIVQRFLGKRFDPLIIISYSFFAGTILLLPFLNNATEQIINASVSQISLLIFLGVCPSALAYLFWAKALSIAPTTSNVSNYMFLTPFLALLLEYTIINDIPSIATFVGGGIIMASLCIFLGVSGKSTGK